MPDQRRIFTSTQILVLLAWEAGEISTGRAAKLLATDIVTAREMRAEAVRQGTYLDQDGGFVRTCCTEWRVPGHVSND